MARSLRDRLVFELDKIRDDLTEAVGNLPPADLDWAPSPGMKSYRALFTEIGAMEAESSILLRTGRCPTWEECEAYVAGETTEAILESLMRIRGDTLAYLTGADDGKLRTPVPIPEDWWAYMGDKELEPEELIRWVARHEYYHVGQITTYRWIQGHDPYKKS